jgi:hypothetical protein
MALFNRSDRAQTVASATFVGRKNLRTSSAAYYGLTKSNQASYLITGQDISQESYLINWRSDYTQAIANNFQYWNAIRNYPESTGQIFINSMACEIDNLYYYWRSSRKKLWLETADSSEVFSLTRLSLPDHIVLNQRSSKNLLMNGGFDLRSSAIFNQPDCWTDMFGLTTGLVESYKDDSVSSGPCVRFLAGPSKNCYLNQKVALTLGKGNSLVLSVWYKTPVNSRADSSISLPKLNIIIKLMKDDGSYHITRKPLRSGTSLRWLREWVRVDAEHDIRQVEVSFELRNNSNETIEYYLDSVQLEIGTYPTEFRRNANDIPEHVRTYNIYTRPDFDVQSWGDSKSVTGQNIAGYYCTGTETKKTVYYPVIGQESITNYYLCPTDVSVATGTTGLSAIQTRLNGLYNNNLEYNPYEKGWLIISGNSLTTYPWPNQIDATGRHYIADRNISKQSILSTEIYDDTQVYQGYTNCNTDSFIQGVGYTGQIEAFTFGNEKLWAICKEAYASYTGRTLKIAYPRYYGDEGNIQCIADFRLPELGTGGNVTSVGLLESDKTKLVVSMTGTIPATLSGSTINLKYDYFLIDDSRRQVFLRDTSEDRTVIIL